MELSLLLKTIRELETARDSAGIVEKISEIQEDIVASNHVITDLLAGKNWFALYAVGKHLISHGYGGGLAGAALGLGAVVCNQEGEARQGARILYEFCETLTPGGKDVLKNMLIETVSHLAMDNYSKGNHKNILLLLDIFKAGYPPFRSMFNLYSQDYPKFEIERARRSGRETAKGKLITFPTTPVDMPRQHRRVLVCTRKYVTTSYSREYEFGYFLNQALTVYGWTSSLFGIPYIVTMHDVHKSFQDILEKCLQVKPDVLFYDIERVLFPANLEGLGGFIRQLRQTLPDMKIVAIIVDAHWFDLPTLRFIKDTFDLAWTLGANLAWLEESLQYKNCTVFPQQCEDDFRGQIRPLKPHIDFSGSIQPVSWTRAFWLSAIMAEKIPIQFNLKTYQAEDKGSIETYRTYNQTLAESCCAINFSMRANLTSSYTARPFEVILNRALLVQEVNPALYYYFTPGEHYLEFSSLDDLRAISRLIAEFPEKAEEVRRDGYVFAQSRYNNDRLVNCFDWHLFCNPQQAPARNLP